MGAVGTALVLSPVSSADRGFAMDEEPSVETGDVSKNVDTECTDVVSSGYSGSPVADDLDHADDNTPAEPEPFRAVDLLGIDHLFRRDTGRESTHVAEPGASDVNVEDLFGNVQEQLQFSGFQENVDSERDWTHVTDHSVQSVNDCAIPDEVDLVEREASGPVVSSSTWNQLVAGSVPTFRELPSDLKFPWETGTMATVFNFDVDPLPRCPGLAEVTHSSSVESPGLLQSKLAAFALPDEAQYVHAVKSMRDMSYFEDKNQKLELACAQWLNILSTCWSASGIGPQLVSALQQDNSGAEAVTILKSCFGVKSPSTILKRASAFRNYMTWFDKNPSCQELNKSSLPLDESSVWLYFNWLRNRRIAADKGFTVPTSFLESVRFAKFTVDLNGTDAILCSRRLLGFAAIEQREKGPLKQAPGLELEHMRRLHQILQSDGNLIDRLGAGAFLICLYGRARWSDLRFVSHADISGDDFMTLYTTEHKTASVGLKRQQFLPIAVPWEGVTSDPWLRNWLDIYQRCGLNISQKPLGPLLPAPRLDGSFCARPLTTSEAAMWLRGLLKGTNHCETFRSHSLKASLLLWCARAGLDKETRAVLGHHCAALSGSEVVYSRQLQTRALRKLSLILRRVRMGQTLEDDAMKEFGVVSTPLPFTPATAARTPVAMPQQVGLAKPVEQDEVDNSAVTGAVKLAMECEDLQSVKEEQFDLQAVEAAANELTLFQRTLSAWVLLKSNLHLEVTVRAQPVTLPVQRSWNLREISQASLSMCLKALTFIDMPKVESCMLASLVRL